MADALVTPALLRRARERAGLSVEGLADKLKQPPEKVAAWERGEARPTFRQAEALARKTHVPFGYLYLPEPPEDALPIPDLRTMGGEPPPALDADFRDLLNDVLFKQDWYRDYRRGSGWEDLPFVGRFRGNESPETVAADIRDILELDVRPIGSVRGPDALLTALSERAEAAGIWVMRNGVVGNNPHRPLSVDMFRGFALSDPVVPLVFINGRDAKAGQVFTLAHELAHIWFGQSGVSDPLRTASTEIGQDQDMEVACNRTAEAVLMPATAVEGFWASDVSLEENVEHGVRFFRVSRAAVALRAYHFGMVQQEDLSGFLEAERERWRREQTRGDNAESGGDFHKTAPARHGNRYLRAVVGSAMEGELLMRDAAALLNVKPKTIIKMYYQQ